MTQQELLIKVVDKALSASGPEVERAWITTRLHKSLSDEMILSLYVEDIGPPELV